MFTAMYSAYCPNCGGVLTSQTPGAVRIGCPCGWVGHLTMAPVPNIGGLGGLLFTPPVALAPVTQPSAAQAAAQAQALAVEARRDHARHLLANLAGDAHDQMCALSADEWGMEPWRAYERLQAAHARLFETLGGVRMGAYRAQVAAARAAVIETLLWTLLLFDNATR